MHFKHIRKAFLAKLGIPEPEQFKTPKSMRRTLTFMRGLYFVFFFEGVGSSGPRNSKETTRSSTLFLCTFQSGTSGVRRNADNRKYAKTKTLRL